MEIIKRLKRIEEKLSDKQMTSLYLICHDTNSDKISIMGIEDKEFKSIEEATEFCKKDSAEKNLSFINPLVVDIVDNKEIINSEGNI